MRALVIEVLVLIQGSYCIEVGKSIYSITALFHAPFKAVMLPLLNLKWDSSTRNLESVI